MNSFGETDFNKPVNKIADKNNNGISVMSIYLSIKNLFIAVYAVKMRIKLPVISAYFFCIVALYPAAIKIVEIIQMKDTAKQISNRGFGNSQ